jgi:hypothetical protein
MSPRPSASERARLAALALLTTACVLGAACRQTVMLDTAESGAGGAGGNGGTAGAVFDAGSGGDHTGGGAFGGTRFDGGRPDGLGFCQFQSVPIDMRSPFVIVSVDRSSDMQVWFGGGTTRLDFIQQEVLALVTKYRFVKWGYQEFPAPMGMCGTQGCCAGDVTNPSYSDVSFRAIRQAIHACDGGGASCNQSQKPIADALSKIFNAYRTMFSPDIPGHRYVVLLTSGDPTCLSDPMSMSMPCADATAQVTKLHNTFTNTSVFGVGDNSSSKCLDDLATYGGLGGTHIVKTPNDLSSALDNVVDTIAAEACTIDIRTAPPDPKTVQLLFDSIPVPNDPVNGWTFEQGTTMTLTVHGTYCHMLEQNVGRIDLVAGCALPHN